MERDRHSDEEILKILQMKNVAVVGASRNPEKAAHFVPRYLRENGYNVIPVNPATGRLLGVTCHRSVSEIEEDIDIVDLFRPSDQILPVVRDAISKRPKVIWMQEGIHDPEAERLASEAGIDVVYNRCMLAEHARLF